MAQGRPTTQQGIIQPIAYIINDNLRFLLHLQSGIIIELTTKKGSHEKIVTPPSSEMSSTCTRRPWLRTALTRWTSGWPEWCCASAHWSFSWVLNFELGILNCCPAGNYELWVLSYELRIVALRAIMNYWIINYSILNRSEARIIHNS